MPIGSVLLAFAHLRVDPLGPVKKCLTICSDVDRAVRTEGYDCSSQLSASGASREAPNWSVQHKTCGVLLAECQVLLSLAETLIHRGVSPWPPDPSPPKAKVLLEGIDPTAIRVHINVIRGGPVTFVREDKMGWLLASLDLLKALPCVALARG